MAVDITRISINTDPTGFASWLDYSDMLQELADELDAFRNVHRPRLSSVQRNRIRLGATKIREEARTLATVAGIRVLTGFDSELAELRRITKEMDELIKDINKVKEVISGITEVLGFITNIFSLF